MGEPLADSQAPVVRQISGRRSNEGPAERISLMQCLLQSYFVAPLNRSDQGGVEYTYDLENPVDLRAALAGPDVMDGHKMQNSHVILRSLGKKAQI